jgi:hypothetical protein
MATMNVRGTEVQVITREEWDLISYEQKEQNAKKRNRSTHGIEPCKLCGQIISDKALETSWFVHMTVNGDLFPVAVELGDHEGSQGMFPIGASCAKKIPKEFKKKF